MPNARKKIFKNLSLDSYTPSLRAQRSNLYDLLDVLNKSRLVIPAKAGIQENQQAGPCLRRGGDLFKVSL